MSSIPVPLTVRIGNDHVTHKVVDVGFRKEAIGGLRSIGLKFNQPLTKIDSPTAYTRCYIYDARTAETIAEGQISDLGRTAGPGGQQEWDIVAFGPAQLASDNEQPYLVTDKRLDAFARSRYSTGNATTRTNEQDEDNPAWEVAVEEGKSATTSWVGDVIYRLPKTFGFKLGRVRATVISGITNANFSLRLATRLDAGAPTTAASTTASTSSGNIAGVVSTGFADGHNVVSLRVTRQTSTYTGTESAWFQFYDVAVRVMQKNADGTDLAAGNYTTAAVPAEVVVNDLLGRYLTQYDGANATVEAGTFSFDQLAYPDGVTPAQVLDDLMLLEPTFRWYCGPSTAGGDFSFTWEEYPTTVRYEATLDDGGDFPASARTLYNQCVVRWQDWRGITRSTTTTATNTILDDAGVTRTKIVDLSDEIGSSAQAAQVGANILADSAYPKNAGTLSISRPIRDLTTGGLVQPWEIEPGELVRVRGVESYTDALNASSNDGQTVFRIWAIDYTADDNTARLELDSSPLTNLSALVSLLKRRDRKR